MVTYPLSIRKSSLDKLGESIAQFKENTKEISLRLWQNELVKCASETDCSHLAINCPTGSGKSIAALAIMSEIEHDTNNLIIISVPQRNIGQGFINVESDPVTIGGVLYNLPLENQLCANYSDKGSIVRLKEFLESFRQPELTQRIIICCHATLGLLFSRLSKKEKDILFRDVKLYVDESHHVSTQERGENNLGSVVNHFLRNQKNGLNLCLITATPFRGDQFEIVPKKYLNSFERFDLDYGRHFDENCNGLEFKYDAVFHPYDKCYSESIKELIEEKLLSGSKILIQIPVTNSRWSNGKYNDLEMIKQCIGDYTVLDLVTDDAERELRLNEFKKNTSSYDVVIGMNLIKEGFDWPEANVGIFIGPQGSITSQIQLMGRTFRASSNKGMGQNPVELYQVFPYFDYDKIEEEAVKTQVNDFMKVVYSALSLDLVFNPVEITVPTKGTKETIRMTVGDILKDFSEQEIQQIDEEIMSDIIQHSALNENLDSKEIKQLIANKLEEFGVKEEYREALANSYYNKQQRHRKLVLCRMDGLDPFTFDYDIIQDVENPLKDVVMQFSNVLCGSKDIKEFSKLIKPVDTLRRCYELKEWVERNGRYPSVKSKDRVERSLGMFISTIRGVYRGSIIRLVGIGTPHFDIVESIPNWEWEPIGKLDKCYELKEWVEKHGRYPKKDAKNLEESKLGIFMSGMKSSYSGGASTLKISPERIKILESIPGWRWSYTNLDKAIELKEWVEKHGKFPTRKEQNHMNGFLRTIKSVKKGLSTGVLTNDVEEVLESIPNWEWYKKYDDTFEELKQWIINNGIPSKISKNKEERKFGYKLTNSLSRLRKGLSLSGNGQKILESIPNWENILNPKSQEEIQIDKCKELKKWVELNGRFPSYSEEKKYISFIDIKKQAYKGSGKHTITTEQIKILESIPGWKWEGRVRKNGN